jgi:geranylgeranyl diphosphate synthase, type I
VRDLALAARPLGIMFQLKDDLLGVFGDPSITGKSASSDLLQGKFTALIVEAANDPNVAVDLARLRKIRADKVAHTDVDALVMSLRHRIIACGARSRVEERIAKLFDEATLVIAKAELTDQGKELLLGAAAVLGGRNQ